MSRIAVLLLVLAVHTTALNGQTPEPPPVFLLVVDDLHLDFRQTPRTRWMIEHTLDALARPGAVWSVVTTGTSGVDLPPTTDVAAVRAAVRRVTGNALRSSETGTAAETERRRRARIAEQGAAAAITQAAAATSSRLTVLYISGGYDSRVIGPPSALIDAALRTQARVIALWPWTLDHAYADVPLHEWQAYLDATQAALRTLAAETGGFAVLTPADLNPALRSFDLAH